jgi:hypothetical protein
MNLEYLIGLIGITMFLSCSQKNAQQESNVQISVQEDDTQKENKQEANVQKGIKYEVRSNGKVSFSIFPDDIEFYDSTQTRGYIEIHELRLKKDFFTEDSLLLTYPIKVYCKINGKYYFWSDFFHRSQSEPRLWINFHFRSSCENEWNSPEKDGRRLRRGDTLVLHTNNECNSIEFFHRRKRIENRRYAYYEKNQHFINYTDTAQLAHEILLDSVYLKALNESGIEIK